MPGPARCAIALFRLIRPPAQPDPSMRAEALRSLAALLCAGWPLRSALQEWHLYAPGRARADLGRAGRRLGLGGELDDLVEDLAAFFGPDTSALLDLLSLHRGTGAGLGRLLDALAMSLQEQGEAEAQARAASTGARTSGRLIAALPLLALPLAPLGRAPLWDPLGVACLAGGAGLALGGMGWMERLVPPLPASDRVARLADATAGLLRAGLSLPAALEHATRNLAWPEAARARGLAALGMSWPGALAGSGDSGLEALAVAVARAQRLGVPAARSLESFAEWRRRQIRWAFEERARRAPVLMVTPLALCVLPAFLLLCAVPFLRGLALA